MIASVILAINLPFELFLISYAVLGPLHYTTEISWLQKKEYFVGTKNKIILLPICVIVTLASIISNQVAISSFLIFLTFATSFILIFIKGWWQRVNAFVAAFFIALIIKNVPLYAAIFGVLLTTIIHVWLFTGIFILSGAVRNRNISGYVSLSVFILCSLSFYFIPISTYVISSKALEITTDDGLNLNRTILNILNVPFEKTDLVSSSAALKLQAFIAFAYTYHYLNWFSKVEIIKWHKVSKNFLTLSLAIWIASLSLYIYDYKIGTSALLFLSILHVLLEFPLNFLSFKNLLQSPENSVLGAENRFQKKN
jgi:hypothetical protein